MDDAVPASSHRAVHALLDDPVDLQRTRAAVLGAMFDEPVAATTIGRFEIVATAGRGAMGRVYVAFDPELDRTVALKLITDDGDPETAEQRRGRLVGEAQAMAQLTHPNVISVYEVGRHGGDVFIVMQYVQGPNLRSWMRAPGRTLHERLAVLAGAARGLVAAHAAGLVHRDFKPDNVLVDERGHAFVTDFGLARSLSTIPDGSRGLSTAMGGTPAYMAPEQAMGETAAEASDQFAFCVTAWEVLTGSRPTRTAGQAVVVDDDAGGSLPTWIRRVLQRGMATRPEERWPTMDALARALTPERGRRRRYALAGTAAAALAVGGWIALHRPDPCVGAGKTVQEHYGDAERDALRAAFAQTRLGYAPAATEHAIGALDAFSNEWREAARTTCEMSRDELRTDAMIDRGLLCLAEARSALRAATDVLVDADAEVVRRSTAIVGGLPSIDACLDPGSLMADVAPPGPEVADEVGRVRNGLADVRAALLAGREAFAEEASSELLATARIIGYAPLHAEAVFLRAHVLDRAGQLKRARELFADAYFLAGAIDHHTPAAQSATELVSLHGGVEPGIERAREWYRHARMASDRSPRTAEYGTRATNYLAWAELEAGNVARARELAERSVDEAAEISGADSEQVGHAYGVLGVIAMQQGDHDEASERLAAAIELVERHQPPGPALGRLLNNAGIVARRAGAYDEGAEYLKRSLEIKVALFGEEHHAVATSYNSLGLLEKGRGNYQAAADALQRALEIRRAVLPEHHVEILHARVNLASLAAVQEDYALAIERAAPALREHEAAGTSPLQRVPGMLILSDALCRAGRPEEALAHATRARELTTEARPRSDYIPLAMIAQASALNALAHPEQAHRHLLAAQAFEGQAPLEDDALAQLHLELALARRALGAAHDEVRALAQRATDLAQAPASAPTHRRARQLLEALPDGSGESEREPSSVEG